MTTLTIALLLSRVRQTPAAPAGNPDAGKTVWANTANSCSTCHGAAGEGGFGPDLAGYGLGWAQFARAVRQPWGIMPA